MRVAQTITLTDEERAVLVKWSRGRSTPTRLVLRAKIVLAAAEGRENKDIAEDLVTHLMSQGSDLPQPAVITQDPEPKAIRLALGLSQIGFAQALGISPRYI